MAAQFQDFPTPVSEADVFAAGPAGPAAGQTAAAVAAEGHGGVSADMADGTTFAPPEPDPGTPSELFCFSPWDATPTAPASSSPGLVGLLESWLRSPMALTCFNSNGYVPIHDAISLCTELMEASRGHLHTVEDALRDHAEEGPIVLSSEGRAVQLRSYFVNIEDNVRAENCTLPPGWRSFWDHSHKRFMYFPCDVDGACYGPPTWEKPSCASQSLAPAMTSQLAPQAANASFETAPQEQHASSNDAEGRTAADGLAFMEISVKEEEEPAEDSQPSQVDEQDEVQKDSFCTTANDGLASTKVVGDDQEGDDALFQQDPWQMQVETSTSVPEYANDDKDPLFQQDPWQIQVEPSTTVPENAMRWNQWFETMNSNSDIPDAWGHHKKRENDLYVAGMNDFASEEFLHTLFGSIQIKEMHVPCFAESVKPRGFAFVNLVDKSQIDEAIRRLDGSPVGINGRTITVARHNPPGRKGMDGKNANLRGKGSGYKGMSHDFKGKRGGVKGRDALFKGKGRSYAGKGFPHESLVGASVDGSTDGSMITNAEFFPQMSEAMTEPSLVAVCGSNVTLQQGWFQNSDGGLLPYSYWSPAEPLLEVPMQLPTEGFAEVAAGVAAESSAEASEPATRMQDVLGGTVKRTIATIPEASEHVPEDAVSSGLEFIPSAEPPRVTPVYLQGPVLSDPEPEPLPEQQEDYGPLREALEKWLGTPKGAACFNVHGSNKGFLPIQLAIESSAEVKKFSRGRPEAVVAAIHAGTLDGLLALSDDKSSVRARGLLERARVAAEMHVAQEPAGNISLLDLLTAPPVASVLSMIPETTERLQTLKDALFESSLVRVCGSRVTWQQCLFYEGDDPTTGFYYRQMQLDPGSVTLPANNDEFGPSSGITSACWGGKAGAKTNESHGNRRVYHPQAGESAKAQRLDRRVYVCKQVCNLLRSPEVQEIASLDPDGWVPIWRLFEINSDFSGRMFRNPAVVIKGITGELTQTVLGLDAGKQLVRLLSASERLAAITEQYLIEQTPPAEVQLHMQPAEVLLDELLQQPAIEEVFQQSQTSSRWRTPRTLLRQALEQSDDLKVRADELLGTCVVSMRPVDEILQRDLELFMDTDIKVKYLLKHEGEAPLSWVAEQRPMQRTFAKIKTQDLKDVELQALRSAVEKSSRYELDDSQVSIRCADQTRFEEAHAMPRTSCEESWGPKKRQLWEVKEKDAVHLRKLLMHYFDPFNLQHNRVLMAIIHAQRKRRTYKGYLRDAGHRPVFSLQDLANLPRIGRLLELYDEAGSWLLAAALKSDQTLPVRMCQQRDPRAPRGAWATLDPKIELTYMPNFRFIEVVYNCPEVQPLLAPTIDPHLPTQQLPGNAFCIVSFSVSSDLSHNQSPKSLDVIGEITAGGLDPATMTWESRLPKIRRQLLQFGPDVICVQGVQSIGFAERDSELEAGWFNSDNEPTSNHLVYLYRELSKENYGVTFSPTLKLPGSAVVCFGNAVFWKRSRWQVVERWSIQRSAVCVRMSSRLSGIQLVICSSKPPAAYIRDWGDSVADADLIEPMRSVQEGLMESVANSEARPVWCGDFACEPRVLMPGLSIPTSTHVWQCASMTVSDGEPVWTSVSKYTAGSEVDLVLHDQKLEVLAGLGGLDKPNSLVDLLKTGYSSDHLLQMAVFKNSTQSSQGRPEFQERWSSSHRTKWAPKEYVQPVSNPNLPADSRWRVPMRSNSDAHREAAAIPISPPPGLPSRVIAFQ